jgi:trimethylamine corrinoid protein
MSDDTPVRLYQAFVSQDPAAAIKVIESVRSSGVPQAQLFDALFAPALALLGAAWAAGDVDEVTFTQAAVVAEQVTSFVTPPSSVPDTGVSVLIGCMQKDRHAVVKNVVAAALKEAGNRVFDLGVDVRPADFVAKVEETGARIVVVCAEMLGTARTVSRVRDALTAAGRDDTVILVAGGPFEADADIAKSVGSNGVLRSAESAVRIVAKVAVDRFGAGGGGAP